LTTLRFPPTWANNTNYSSGPDTGTPTKVDPNSSANGFIRGVGSSAQGINFLFQAVNSVATRALTIAMCKPRKVADLTLDVLGSVAPVSQGLGVQAVVGTTHSAGVPRISDIENDTGGVVAGITGAVNGAARNPSTGRLLLVGASGARRCAFSDNGGGTWSQGADLTEAGFEVIWNPTYSRFQVLCSGDLKYSADGASWTNVAIVAGTADRGMALLPNGDTAVVSTTSPLATVVSTNGGTSWSAGGVIPNAASISGGGCLAGRGLDYAWHAGTISGGGSIQISRTSGNFASWTAIATITAPAGHTFGTVVALRQCRETGALWLGVNTAAGGALIFGSLDGGGSWSEPVYGGGDVVFNSPSRMHAVDGRVWCVDGSGGLYVSDGIGWL
jgi:hypothetical protein